MLPTSLVAQHVARRLPYFIPRNSRGNLPVYTDVKNNGARYFIYLRNVEGDVNALTKDLESSLLAHGSPGAERLKIGVVRSKNLVITGGPWKNRLLEWVRDRGF